LGARTEFAGFLICAFVILVAREGSKKTFIMSVPIVASATMGLAIFFNVFSGRSRILQLLDIIHSSSFEARARFSDFAWETLREHPLLGQYGSQLQLGSIGSYAHNMLSAWVSYGLIGFLLVVLVFLYMIWKCSLVLLQSRAPRTPLTAAAVGFTVYNLLVAIASKPVYDPVYAVAFGLIAALMLERRQCAKSASIAA
jgi:O-antigen ligase